MRLEAHSTAIGSRNVAKTACVVALLILPIVAPRSTAAELSAEATKAIDAAVARSLNEHHIPGLSLAVATGGQLNYEHGYGQADVENSVPATPQTVYRLASISKMLTAVAALQLAEQGKLDLDAPIQKYVPEFPEKDAKITAELLLKHQSGIRHYQGDEVRSAVFYSRVKDTLAIFQADPLLFTPGEKFSYTTYGYNVLGAAIEGASGQDYVGYVQQHVCAPAGMKTIQPDNPYKIIPHRAAGYRLRTLGSDGQLVNDFMVDVSNKIPGGGWCSTAGDLVRFATALMDGQLVRRETLDKMWTVQKTAGGEETRSGLGCFIEVKNNDRRISHSGGQPKVSTYLIFSPANRAAVALMCNLQGAAVRPLAEEILDLVVKQ